MEIPAQSHPCDIRYHRLLSDFCILCAAPRSGTTLLGDAVKRGYQCAVPAEIFHEDCALPALDYRNSADAQQRGNFFNFRAELIRSRPELYYPHANARRQLFELYLNNLRTLFPNERFLLDIKYTSWHHLDGFRRDPAGPPGLMELIRDRNIPVVHLIRRNLFSLYVSTRIAIASGIWERVPSEPANRATLTIDLDHCRLWMTNMARTQKLFSNWLSGCRVYNLTYESLTEKDAFANAVTGVFTGIFGGPPEGEITPGYAKILPPLHYVVENAGRVRDYFAGSEFEGFVNAALAG